MFFGSGQNLPFYKAHLPLFNGTFTPIPSIEITLPMYTENIGELHMLDILNISKFFI